jgi:hypothetical protein
MKKIVVFAAIILCTGSLFAQQRMEISVFTEPQLSWLSSDEGAVTNSGNILHLNTGIAFDFFFMKNYAFSAGFSLNNAGGKMLYNDSISFAQAFDTLGIPRGTLLKHNLQYLSVPLGLKLKSEEMGFTTFYFHGGFVPMLNINAKTSSDVLGIDRENIKPEINFFNFNYFLEAGIEYRLAGNTAVVAGLKWSSGFTDITRNDRASNNLNTAGLHLGIIF